MVILSRIRFKYSIMLDIAILVILIVMQSFLHEASHALAVITLGGEVDAIVINAFDPEQSYVDYKLVYSDYSELYQALIKLLPHLLLGIIGFYLTFDVEYNFGPRKSRNGTKNAKIQANSMRQTAGVKSKISRFSLFSLVRSPNAFIPHQTYLVHKGIRRIKLAGKDAVDKYTYLLIGLLHLGIGMGWFLPLRYVNLRSYHQFDIPQATMYLSSFAHLRLPEGALFLSNLSAEFQMRLLIFGLIGLSGMIYVGLRLSLGQSDHTSGASKRSSGWF